MMEIDSSPGMGSAVAKAPAVGEVQRVALESRGMQAVILSLAQIDVPVLLRGERGVGKRTLAKRIHELSPRSQECFRVLPCRVLWPEAFDSEGEGGFLGRGTIYLDEVDDLNPECQQRLVQALAGANLNGERARLICGTARNLEAEVESGSLREDLYCRISGVSLQLAPLRQRPEDIPELLNHFLCKYARDLQLPVPRIGPETRCRLEHYSWPGNVRELEEAVKAIVGLGEEAIANDGLGAWLHTKSELPKVTLTQTISLKAVSRAASRSAERELILGAMTRTGWNRRRAAQELQISYKALLYKLKQIGCEEDGASRTS